MRRMRMAGMAAAALIAAGWAAAGADGLPAGMLERDGFGGGALRAWSEPVLLPVPAAPRVAFDGERATASWDAIAGATGYELAWGAEGAISSVSLDAEELTFTTGALTAGARYGFRLRVLNESGRSDLSSAAGLTPTAWPNAVPAATFKFYEAAGMLVEWAPVEGVDDYVVGWTKRGDASRSGATAATGSSLLATRDGGFFSGVWLLRVRVAGTGMWSDARSIWVQSPAPELRFWLESSRTLCTEGTLTEIRWRGGGGAGNLWPHINGRMIGEATYRVKVNCGMIPRTADGELDQTQLDAVITGHLLDGRGTIKSASIRIPRAPALPAPTNIDFSAQLSQLTLSWDAVAGAGRNMSPAIGNQRIAYGFNTRPVGTATWQTESVAASSGESSVWHRIVRSRAKEWEFSVAAVRHGIELETPAVLNWSSPQRFRTTGKPENLSVDTTHNSMTVRFDRQPLSGGGLIEVIGDDGVTSAMYYENGEEGQHEIVIGNLEPNEEYTVRVAIFAHALSEGSLYVDEFEASATVRTAAAPAGWTSPPAGARNVRISATASSITVRWDPPEPDGTYKWQVTLRLVSDDDSVGGFLIDRRYIINGNTEWTTWGSAISARIQPATTYRVRITQTGVREHFVEALVTTPPAGGATAEQSSGTSDPLDHPSPEFIPMWPVSIDSGHRMTDDLPDRAKTEFPMLDEPAPGALA